jgi:succinoglycan biosynthesis protein ExoM
MTIQRLAVCICTYRRPDDLRRLLARLHSEVVELHNVVDLGVVVIDDDSDLSAKAVVDGFDGQFPLGLHYASTASGNISVARNRAVDTGLPLAEALAFIDDDCLPDPGWLQQLLAVQQRTDCDIVSGCCHDQPPTGSPRWLTDAPFLAGPLTLPDAATIEIGALKNTLVTTQFLQRSQVRFDPQFGTAGGEDVMWYRAAVTAAATIRYAAHAVVREMIPPSRTRLPYLLRRALWYGNTEVITGLAVGSQSRARMALSGAKCMAGSILRPWSRLAKRTSPQWRYASTELLRGVGRVTGAAGVRIRHH